MNSVLSAKTRAAKYVTTGILLLMSVFLTSCAIGTNRMVEQATKPPLAAKADKAVLVIVRTTSYGWGVVIDNYLDGKMIGQTQGRSYFITDVMPGVHYVMGKAENVSAARMTFDAGKIYFLGQGIYPGWLKARTGFTPLTYEEALKEIKDEKCSYRIYDTKNPGEDLPAKDYQETKDDFEREVKEDPSRHKNTLEYKGYGKL